MTPDQLEALCEWAAGERAAGRSWAAMEEQLVGVSEEVVGRLPNLVEAWLGRQRLMTKREANGDRRAKGERSVGAQSMEVIPGVEAAAAAGELVADPVLIDRANALRVVTYLRDGMLRVRWRWRYVRVMRLATGESWEVVEGPGEAVVMDGEVVKWLVQAVVVRDAAGAVVAVFPESRAFWRREGCGGPHRRQGGRLEIQRREADCRELDLRELAARLAAVLATALGADGSGFKDNAELARILGVTREAVRVRKLRIAQNAGMRAVEGLAPARAAGGKAAQRKRRGE
jgi:hypothetical protein